MDWNNPKDIWKKTRTVGTSICWNNPKNIWKNMLKGNRWNHPPSLICISSFCSFHICARMVFSFPSHMVFFFSLQFGFSPFWLSFVHRDLPTAVFVRAGYI